MKAVTEAAALSPPIFVSLRRFAAAAASGLAVMAALTACELPFSLGLASTKALESGAAGSLSAAKSLEITGSYTDSGERWSIDLQMARPDAEHVVLGGGSVKLEAIVLGKEGYFRGQQFLSQHMGSDPLSRNLVAAAGSGWWKGSTANAPRLPDLTDGGAFRSTFLGAAVTQRTDYVAVDGVDAVDLAGPRAEVFVAAAEPYQLLRVRLRKGVVVDGIEDGDLRFGGFGHDFGIAAPTDVIDFSNLSTLPPIYTVVSVDTSRCGSTCVVSAVLKNLGALRPAQAPSTITFTMTDSASKKVVGSCQTAVKPDVGYNATTTVQCTIDGVSGQTVNAATVTATPTNPGRG